MSKETGGPAFPTQNWESDGNGNIAHYQVDGMTLRDYFAAKAMQALITANGPAPNGGWPTYTERTAYTIADAMLKARNE